MNSPLSRRRLLVLCATLLLPAAFAFAEDKPEDAAQKAAEKWLGGIDAGGYAPSWDEAAVVFQKSLPKPTWEDKLSSVRIPLGKLVSRRLKSAKYTKSLPGAPDGEYVILQFDTVFENKKEAVETVTPILEKDRGWRVGGYFIK